MTTRYFTTAIPYVNAAPHLGHALELVETDVLARHARSRGHAVHFLTGTDDHAAKNVAAAAASGVPVADFVTANGQRFAALREPLALSTDDFLHTASDPRHRPAVERLWARCRAAGDLYTRHYRGLFCNGCEQFVEPAELVDGLCPEHRRPPEPVSEENWFFRLSRYETQLRAAITSGRLTIEPRVRRNEVLAFIDAGLRDFSVSRLRERSRGWGIAVPGDPAQIVYVWFDALINYISALGYGTEDDSYRTWWLDSDTRTHVVGKGIIRFHAVSWPAILLSAGEPLPTTLFVHDYLTVDGVKISKSLGNTVDPVALVDRFGTDALRWWLLRGVPRVGDADFTVAGLVDIANRDLANGIGNLVRRIGALTHARHGDERSASVATSAECEADALRSAVGRLPGSVDDALERFDVRGALEAITGVVTEANRFLEVTRPWEHGSGPGADAVAAARGVARELGPFVPDLSARALAALGAHGDPPPPGGVLFPRLADSTTA